MRTLSKRLIAPDSGNLVGRDVEFRANAREAFEMEQAGQAERVSETASVKPAQQAEAAPSEDATVSPGAVADATPATTKEAPAKKATKKK